MTTTKKTTGEPVRTATNEVFDGFESFATAYFNGIERLAEMQKKSIDLVAQQNAELVNIFKKTTRGLPASGLYPIDIAASAFTLCAETQKTAIDLVVENSQAFATLFQERNAAAAEIAEKATTITKEAVERSIAAQKKTLDSTAAQSKAAFEKTRQQFGSSDARTEALADSFLRGVDTVIETQKDLLDIAANPIQNIH